MTATKWTAHALRERFLKFFEAKDHRVFPSDSLVPSDDPTVLFTSAGMNQFKPYFLGQRTDVKRAASSQKCLRTGDFDAVGDASHHSFFEMLGNFSFGDYFKKEAIAWGWEFLTGELGLPKDKLWVSVFQDDDEAAQLWTKHVPKERIKRFGEADNFWPANAPSQGPNGPCGPCSEIYFDADGTVEGKGSLEVWNLVFTQFDRQSDGSLQPLPKQNIDTGMGLERLARVIQGAPTDYETDLFAPIIQAVRALPVDERKRQTIPPEQMQRAERAIADHVRGVAFLLSDGVMPSNEGRGYILRMLIRRGYRYGVVRLGVDPRALNRQDETFVWTLIEAVRSAMAASPYAHDLTERVEHIRATLRGEEQQFAATLEEGNYRLAEHLQQLRAKGRAQIGGEEAFKLYDTYGLPLEVTLDIAAESGFTVDREGFNAALKAQQERSRQKSQFGGKVFVESYRQQLAGFSATHKNVFLGYTSLETTGQITAIFREEASVKQARTGEDVDVVITCTPFYGESGGQVGDAGVLDGTGGQAQVLDTQRADETIVHRCRVMRGSLQVGDTMTARVDGNRRQAIMCNHTATHILHSVLREVLGTHVQQCGSLIAPDRLRFDFSHHQALTDQQIAYIEEDVNLRVAQNDEVQLQELPFEDARKTGALAFFGDKYGAKVRVRTIGDYSKEFCGGTHLTRVGAISAFRIVSEGSVAAGVRRIEAVTGAQAALLTQRETELKKLVDQFAKQALAWESVQQYAATLEQRSRRVNALLQHTNDIKADRERQEKRSQQTASLSQVDDLLTQRTVIDSGATLIRARVTGVDREGLRRFVDVIKEKQGMAGTVVVLGSGETGDVVVGATDDLVQRRFHAGQFIKELVKPANGSGGGRPDFAQGGVKDPAAIPAMLAGADGLLRKVLIP